jgi:hypothetical protein
MLCLQHDFYNIIFKIRQILHCLRVTPLPPRKSSRCAPKWAYTSTPPTCPHGVDGGNSTLLQNDAASRSDYTTQSDGLMTGRDVEASGKWLRRNGNLRGKNDAHNGIQQPRRFGLWAKIQIRYLPKTMQEFQLAQLEGSLYWRHLYTCLFQKSWIGSLMPLSALFGGIAGGPLIESIGRKTTILATAVPFIVCKYHTMHVTFAHTLEVCTHRGPRRDYARHVLNSWQYVWTSQELPGKPYAAGTTIK